MVTKKEYDRNVFVNCAFDRQFLPMFRALVFTIHNCGFIARCALEAGNRDGVRIDKIYKIIEECRYGIHDLSCVEVTEESPLPRFNMPYELGVFMGCKRFGAGLQAKKDFLVLDALPHRYKRTISDLAGYDFDAHNANVNELIEVVRNWLQQASGVRTPGPLFHQQRFGRFIDELPELSASLGYHDENVPFGFFYALVTEWIQSENEKLLVEEEPE